MITAAAIRKMAEMGLDADQIAEVAEALEDGFARPVPNYEASLEKKRERDRGRMRAKREQEKVSRDVAATSPATSPLQEAVPFSPTPPNLSEELPTPFTPLKGGVSPSLAKPNGFARFWEAYPNKTAKRAAEKAFAPAAKRITDRDPIAVMLAGIARAKRSRKWREGFIPNPATWLNGDCWDDDPDGELARQARPAPKAEPAVYAAHVRHFHDTGEWKDSWGPKPSAEAAA
jgi:hypothetical protein